MAWTKVKTAAVAGIGVAIILGGGAVMMNFRAHSARAALVARAYTRSHLTDPKYQAVLAELRATVWPKEKELAEAQIKARQEVNETTNAVTINLKPFINATLTDSPASAKGIRDNNLASLPLGKHLFGAVPFDVQGLVQLDGTNMVMVHKRYPAGVHEVPVDRKCVRLHLFHGANWIYRRDFGTAVAKLVLHYADGSTREIPMLAGEHVFNWWSPLFTTGVDARDSRMAASTERAWTGSNPFIKQFWPDESLVLYKSSFENPQPEISIASLDYVATGTGVAPFLVGLTVE
jgi:hypothetical protein